LIRTLADFDPGLDLALTTNGSLLARHAPALADAGLDRVTVSFHSLDDTTARQLSGVDAPLSAVLDGLATAKRAGLGPIKLNVVAMRDGNASEIVDLARFGRDHGYVLRFIEYMDVGTVNGWDPAAVLSAREIVERIDAVYPLEPVGRSHRGEVAERYRYVDGGGEIGVIPSITQPFCGDCTRVRLSAEGKLYTCLFAQIGHDLKTPLRAGDDDAALAARIRAIWRARTDRYSEERTAALRDGTFSAIPKVEMFRIGG
ncbi:MAG: radical SAM protein, partial [Acidobacteriota bacterium]